MKCLNVLFEDVFGDGAFAGSHSAAHEKENGAPLVEGHRRHNVGAFRVSFHSVAAAADCFYFFH